MVKLFKSSYTSLDTEINTWLKQTRETIEILDKNMLVSSTDGSTVIIYEFIYITK